MKVIDLVQKTQEWHDWRTSGVSASEADIVLKRSPYKTPFRLFAEKKGLILPVNLDRNPHVRRGVRLEPVARRAFEQRHDTLVLPICAESDQYPFIRASFDGITDDGIPVEIKAPTERNFRDAQETADETNFALLFEEDFRDAQKNGTKSKLYIRYYSQVQIQILVAGSDRGWLSLYLNDKEYLDFSVPRDDALIQELIFEARQFVECLKSNKPPDRDPARDIFIPDGPSLNKWNLLASGYHRIDQSIEELKAKIKTLESEKSALEEGFVDLMGDFAQAESAGLRVNRYIQQGAIDYKAALMALNPDLDSDFLEQFRKNSSERTRFTLKDETKAEVPFSLEEVLSQSDNDWFF